MASSKGNSNSSKTAHVMNLLRKSNPAPQESEKEGPTPAAESHVETKVPAASAPEPAKPSKTAPAPKAPAAPQTPPILTAMNADVELSSQIRDALSEELIEGQPVPAPKTADIPIAEPQSKPLQQEADVSVIAEPEESLPEAVPEESLPEAILEEEPVSAKNSVPAEEQVQCDAEQSEPVDPDEPIMVNIIQQLTEECVDTYMELFGVCSCSKCRNDVIALSLTHLPAKYVVMRPSELRLRMDMYSMRYKCEIASQIIQACKVVKDNPRHVSPRFFLHV